MNEGAHMKERKEIPKECCLKCKYHRPDDTFSADWVCCNPDSEFFADYTEAEDTCENFREREG